MHKTPTRTPPRPLTLRAAQGECRPDPCYMEARQQDMTPHMRAILVDWLVEVALEYRLCSDTLHLTVALLDRFLSAEPVSRDQLQLAGIACMWAAAKYEEIYAPSAKEFCFITDNTYSPEQVCARAHAMQRPACCPLAFLRARPPRPAPTRAWADAYLPPASPLSPSAPSWSPWRRACWPASTSA